MNFGNITPPKFFESEDEDSLSVEYSIYERIDTYLNSLEIFESNPADVIDDIFDDMRRKTYSEFSSVKNDGLSVQSTSPFFLTSPLTSSIVMERCVDGTSRRTKESTKATNWSDTASGIQAPNSCKKIENSSFFSCKLLEEIEREKIVHQLHLNVKGER